MSSAATKGAFSTPDGSATGIKAFAFSAPTSTDNKTVTVTDTFNGTPATLGTLTATDAPPFASATYTYSHTVSGAGGTCTSYANTAKIVETGQTAGQTVKNLTLELGGNDAALVLDDCEITEGLCGNLVAGAFTNKNDFGARVPHTENNLVPPLMQATPCAFAQIFSDDLERVALDAINGLK